MTKVADYEGHVISLNDKHRFEVKGPLFATDEVHAGYGSYTDAIDAVVERMKKRKKQSSVDLGLSVLKEDGSGKASIKGIHARLGNLLFNDGVYSKLASERWGGPTYVYPDVPWIQELLIEKAALDKRYAEIKRALDKYGIKVAYTYHARSMAGYETAINDLQKEYANKLAAALATNDHGQKKKEVADAT